MHIVCQHCDTINRVPRAKLAAGGRCGQCHQKLFDGHPAALDTARVERQLTHSGVPLLIDFWAPRCGPCRMMAPEFERAAETLEPAVRLVKVNVDEEPALAARFQVRSIPTLALAFEGRELARAAGARSAPQLVEWTRAELERMPQASPNDFKGDDLKGAGAPGRNAATYGRSRRSRPGVPNRPF